MNGRKGAAEEVGAEALEFFDGVGGEDLEVVRRPGCWVGELTEEREDGVGGGLGGVDEVERMAEGCGGALEQVGDERIVGAAEQKGLGVGELQRGLRRGRCGRPRR